MPCLFGPPTRHFFVSIAAQFDVFFPPTSSFPPPFQAAAPAATPAPPPPPAPDEAARARRKRARQLTIELHEVTTQKNTVKHTIQAFLDEFEAANGRKPEKAEKLPMRAKYEQFREHEGCCAGRGEEKAAVSEG